MKKTDDEIYRERKDFFNRHAESWCDMWYRDETTGRYDKHARDFERLFSIIDLKPGDRVLDVGCGTGVLVPFIREMITGKGVLYELDNADRMIEVNRQAHEADNIHFVVADAEDAPFDTASFDAVICFSCFPHFHDRETAMMNLSRILKHRGTFVVSHFASSDEINRLHRAHDHAVMHDRLPDEAAMRSLFLSAGLSIFLFTDEPGFYCVVARKN